MLGIAVSGELRYQGFILNKLFRADIIARNNLRFATDLAYNEDRLFCTEYALHCDRVNLGPGLCYWYRQDCNSTMGALTAMSDAKVNQYLSEFVGYDRLMELIAPEYPDIASYVAGDAFYRTVNLKRMAPADAPQLRNALDGLMQRYGQMTLDAPAGLFSGVQKAKIRAHMLLKR